MQPVATGSPVGCAECVVVAIVQSRVGTVCVKFVTDGVAKHNHRSALRELKK